MMNFPKKPRASRGRVQGGYTALARCYDSFTKNMDYKKRTEYICALLRNSHPTQSADCAGTPKAHPTKPAARPLLLDLACGTGEYTCALLQRGWDVIGVDASEDMLLVAREKAGEMELPAPLLLCQRLEALDLYGTASAAVCLTDSLNHLTNPKQVQQFFARLALFLEPGAPFIFDVNTLYKHAQVLADNVFVYEEEGVFCTWQNRWNPQQQTTQHTLDIFTQTESGSYERSRESFVQRVYAPEDLTRWLEQAGFAVEHIYEELTTQPPSQTAQRVFFAARKL